jgi:transposase-like protein/IS1 family transposase
METQQISKPTTTCPKCGNASKRFGKNRNGGQRFRCLSCRATFTEGGSVPFRSESYLRQSSGLLALQLLLEGTPIRAAERVSGLHRNTILKLLVIAGERCERRMNAIRNVPAKDVQCDEIWGFVAKKEAHKRPGEYDDDSIGDAWAWVAIERDTKLILAFTVGKRTRNHAFELMFRLRRATSPDSRFQLTTDGLKAYLPAVDEMLMDRCDYAQLIKFYSQPQTFEQRYSPAEIVEAVPVVISGNPNPAKICTSHVERQNLTMRMQIRRLTRLTNAFSKKMENHRAAIALHFAYYNWCRIHGTLRVTPAMEAGIADHIWSLSELLA